MVKAKAIKTAEIKIELLLFAGKLAGVGAVTAALSCLLQGRKVRLLPLWGAKRFYRSGEEPVPSTRGWFHGIMAVAHAIRAARLRSGFHAFLVAQYVASFMLHNAPVKPSTEAKIALVDNYCIAAHIAILSVAGAPTAPNGGAKFVWKALMATAFGQAVGISLLSKKGIEAWAYKISLMPIFASGVLTWHASGRLYHSGTPHVAFLYLAAFSLFAVYKTGVLLERWPRLDAALYDIFHSVQVVATLGALRQAGKL